MYIHVKVVAGSSKEAFEKIDDTHFRIWVKEVAKHNAANNRVFEILKERLATPVVRLVGGAHSPGKLFSISE
jgi:uncharacterized protein YggU (UPF0235/DUF167 family)